MPSCTFCAVAPSRTKRRSSCSTARARRGSSSSRASVAAGEVAAQQLHARRERVFVAVDLGRRVRIDAEHAVGGRLQHRAVGLAGIGDLADLPQGLREAGEREHAFFDRIGRGGLFVMRPATPCESIASVRASVRAMTAPPRQTSPSYSTSDWPGVTARWPRAKRTASVPSSATVTCKPRRAGDSASAPCSRIAPPAGCRRSSARPPTTASREYSMRLSLPWSTISTLSSTSLSTTYHGAGSRPRTPPMLQAFALAEREEEDAGVFADHVALRVADFAGPGREVAREEFAEVALADEADAGRILLRVRGQGRLRGRSRARRSSADRRAGTASRRVAAWPSACRK